MSTLILTDFLYTGYLAVKKLQIAKKTITRNTLSNMSTLKAKEDASFIRDEESIELEQEINRIKINNNSVFTDKAT